MATPKSLSEFVRPEAPPKYFAIDFDDTFFTRNEEALKKNVEAFAKVKQMGYTPFFCTGKPLSCVLKLLGEDFVESTGYNGFPGVYLNGSVVYDDKGDIIYSQTFTREFLSTLLKCIEEEALPKVCTFHSVDNMYSLLPANDKWKQYLASQGFQLPEVKTPEEIENLEIINIYFVCKDLKIADLKEGKDYMAVRTGSGIYDVNPPGVTKMSGIAKLMDHYGLSPETCGFIGDGDNDVEAMELCDISFAVGNASDEIKSHAKWVMEKSYDEAAVAEALGLVYGL